MTQRPGTRLATCRAAICTTGAEFLATTHNQCEYDDEAEHKQGNNYPKGSFPELGIALQSSSQISFSRIARDEDYNCRPNKEWYN